MSEISAIYNKSVTIIAGNTVEETQASVDVLTDVEKFFSEITVSNAETKFHDQKDTNLCHSYAVMSGLRHLLRQFLTVKTQDTDVLKTTIQSMNQTGNSSFYRMLAVFIGCINPRSFAELFKVMV